jgi:DNA-binding response OmpR family regulator
MLLSVTGHFISGPRIAQPKRALETAENTFGLTAIEAALFTVLARNSPKPVAYDVLCATVYGDEEKGSRVSLNHLIARLERKMPEREFQNVYGFGYALAE